MKTKVLKGVGGYRVGGGHGIWILKATQFYHDYHFLDHFL